MKHALKVFCITLLTLLYCSAVGVVSASKAYPGIQGTFSSECNAHFSAASQVLFTHTSQSETAITNFSALPKPGVKDATGGLWAIGISALLLADKSYIRYLRTSVCADQRTRLGELLYPFHYFW